MVRIFEEPKTNQLKGNTRHKKCSVDKCKKVLAKRSCHTLQNPKWTRWPHKDMWAWHGFRQRPNKHHINEKRKPANGKNTVHIPCHPCQPPNQPHWAWWEPRWRKCHGHSNKATLLLLSRHQQFRKDLQGPSEEQVNAFNSTFPQAALEDEQHKLSEVKGLKFV